MKAARLYVLGAVGGLVGVWAMVAGGCASEQQQKGHELYSHYCMHCHGENGRQNEGFNWSSMPDPKPKDLSNKSEMSTFKDEDIFNTISRDMKDTSPGGDKIGDDDFAVPTMPTFKYTLSEDEIWAIVGYVRGLHGMKLEFKVEDRKKELADGAPNGPRQSSTRPSRPMRRRKRRRATRLKRRAQSLRRMSTPTNPPMLRSWQPWDRRKKNSTPRRLR